MQNGVEIEKQVAKFGIQTGLIQAKSYSKRKETEPKRLDGQTSLVFIDPARNL